MLFEETYKKIISEVLGKQLPQYFSNEPYSKVYLPSDIAKQAIELSVKSGYDESIAYGALYYWMSGNYWYHAVESYRRTAARTEDYNKTTSELIRPVDIVPTLKNDFPLMFDNIEFALKKSNVNKSLSHDKTGQKEDIAIGFNQIDNLIKGIRPGELVIMASRPSMGMTDFFMNMAANTASNGKNVAILEMKKSKYELSQRLLCSAAKIDYHYFYGRETLSCDFNKVIHDCMKSKSFSNICIYESFSVVGRDNFIDKVSALHKQREMQLLIVDDIQNMCSLPEGNLELEPSVEKNCQLLREVAIKLQIPVIVMSQLNRFVESRCNKRPILGDLRNFGLIEDMADIVIYLYSDDYYRKNNKDVKVIDVIIAKNRDKFFENLDTIPVIYENKINKYRDVSLSEILDLYW